MRRAALLAMAVVVAALLAARAAGAYVSYGWYEDADGYRNALSQQRIQHAPMLVYFRTDWCPYCRAFDGRLGDAEMQRKLGAAIKVRLNPEHGPEERKLFSEVFGGKSFPSIYWMRDGEPPRKLSAGSSVAEFLGQIEDDLGGGRRAPVDQTRVGDELGVERSPSS